MSDQDPAPETVIEQLITLLDVEELDRDLYRGSRQPGGVGRVFGGQVIAQALQAAQRSVKDKVAHSLHGYFMRPGDENYPIIFRVERDFDGGTFATRRVIAIQKGKPILNMAASFQYPEEGLRHQQAQMPDVPPPEELENEHTRLHAIADRIPEQFRGQLLRLRPIEQRQAAPFDRFKAEELPPFQHCWIRAIAPLPDDPELHRAALAYASDMVLLGTSMRPHPVGWGTSNLQTASLDHALWLHEPFRMDDWLLYSCESPWSGHGRGFNRGQIFTRDGRLVASVTQEVLIRLREKKKD